MFASVSVSAAATHYRSHLCVIEEPPPELSRFGFTPWLVAEGRFWVHLSISRCNAGAVDDDWYGQRLMSSEHRRKASVFRWDPRGFVSPPA